MNKIKCSVGILTFNNENTLSVVLESVKDFDEIIICDGGSFDNTLEVAKKYNCKILQQDGKFKNKKGSLIDYAGARNQTLDASKYDWFLFIDSDEYLPGDIVEEIRDVIKKNNYSPVAYWMPRKYILDGKIIECASTYPNRQMRFFHKSAVIGFIKNIHEKIQLKETVKVSVLKNFMLVPLEIDLLALNTKWNRYIEIGIEHSGKVTLGKCVKTIKDTMKVSILYNFRLLRNLFFCHGKKLPFVYEKEYQLYNFRLTVAILKNYLKK